MTKKLQSKFRAGVVQFDVKSGEIEINLNTIIEHLEKLALDNVNLAVLPEMFSCSFDNENLIEHAKSTDKVLEKLSDFAKNNHMAITGSLPEKIDDKIFNTMMFIDADGKVKVRYKKLHLFKMTNEHLYYSEGNEIALIESDFVKIGLMICYDLRFAELARMLSLKGAQMIIVCAQWPESRKKHWKALIKARAIENQLFMVCSNRTGLDGNLQFPGMSMIVDPAGKTLVKSDNKEGCSFANIDLTVLKKIRTSMPCIEDRRPDIYGSICNN